MELFLIRHGEAVDDAPGLGDTGRWLTARGRVVTRAMARWLATQAQHKPRALVTSPLVRAVQTAELFARELGHDDAVGVWPALSTRGSVQDLLAALALEAPGASLGLVGHEPSLSDLAVHLLGNGTSWSGFDKSAVLALQWDGKKRATRLFYGDPRTL